MQDADDIVMEPEDGEGNTQAASGKLKDVREELKKARAERDEYLDSLQRMKADYINARKRHEDERASLSQYASEAVVMELLPVMDSLDQAIAHGGDTGTAQIRNQLLQMLTRYGVASFDPLGEALDPGLHEPVETLEVEDRADDNKILTVHQKGYTLHGRTIRPARVAVGHYQK